METKERYETTEAPQNGHAAPPDDPRPVEDLYPQAVTEWVEADRVVIHLILAKKRGTPERSVKVGEVNYLDANQRPIALFADADDAAHPWGTALEKFIAAAIEQAGTPG